ncbi:MAG: sulfatase-like hydrolase/transferase [Ferruginibacter sp.]
MSLSTVSNSFFHSRIWFVLRYWLIIILFFEAARIFFLLWNFKEAQSAGLLISLLTLWHGLLMDISMATYIILPFILFLILSVFFFFFRKPIVYMVYSGLIIFLLLFLTLADISSFNSWGFRLDATPLQYFNSPKEMWASIQHLPLLWGSLIFIVIFIYFMWLNTRFLKRSLMQIQFRSNWVVSILSLLLLLGLSVIPIRGGLQLSPINQSSVYFSRNNFANLAAINASWNLMYSLINKIDKNSNPYVSYSMQEAGAIVDSLYTSSGTHESFVDINKNPAPNVILIIWESFTYKVIDKKSREIFITPGYNKLKTEGVYFSNMYATGDRTDKGLAGVLSGYPAQNDHSIIHIPVKSAKMPMLSKEFLKRNYETSFYYGGETEFANMKAYLLQGSFQNFVSINDFQKKDQNSKWGAHDNVVMQRMFNDLLKATKPHFTTWLTLSSHEPYEVPVTTVIKGKDEESLYLNSLHYTDSIIYRFVELCSDQPWWNNTVLIITPDHGKPLPRTGKKVDDFRTSLLFLGGALNRSGIEYDKIGSQVDLAATLLGQLGMSSKSFVWSKDLMNPITKEWAFFAFNNGFGYKDAEGTMIYDHISKKVIQKEGSINEKKGKALQQMIFQDYLTK